MRKLLICYYVLSCTLIAGTAARADETVIHHDDHPPGVVVPLPIPQPEHRDTVIEHRRDECRTKTVHRENDVGDSKTVTKRECD